MLPTDGNDSSVTFDYSCSLQYAIRWTTPFLFPATHGGGGDALLLCFLLTISSIGHPLRQIRVSGRAGREEDASAVTAASHVSREGLNHASATMIKSSVESETRIIAFLLLTSLASLPSSSASPRISGITSSSFSSSFRSPFVAKRSHSARGTFSQPLFNMMAKRWNERLQEILVRQSESKNVTEELSLLQSKLEIRRQKLQLAKEQHRMLSKKLERMIKKARGKRLYFYDSMLLKTMKYNKVSYERIKKQISYIDSTSDLLAEPSKVQMKLKPRIKLRDWQSEVILRKASHENLVDDSDKILADSTTRIQKLNVVLDDLARQKNLV